MAASNVFGPFHFALLHKESGNGNETNANWSEQFRVVDSFSWGEGCRKAKVIVDTAGMVVIAVMTAVMGKVRIVRVVAIAVMASTKAWCIALAMSHSSVSPSVKVWTEAPKWGAYENQILSLRFSACHILPEAANSKKLKKSFASTHCLFWFVESCSRCNGCRFRQCS